MPSKNLGLKNDIDPSDYLDPGVFNANANLIDTLGFDYIVEGGYNGEWWFRKWKSGRAECGIDSKQFGQVSLHGWGTSESGLYATSQFNFGAYPITFSKRPHTNIMFEQDSSNAFRGSMVVMFNNNSTTASPSFEIVDPLNVVMKPLCSIFVAGRYK